VVILDTRIATIKQLTPLVNTMIRLRSSDDFEIDIGAQSACVVPSDHILILKL
jgi:hypothetical protein